MSDYTKGEWKVLVVAMERGCYINTNDGIIATIRTKHDNYLANARLIAAAPELYEALKETGEAYRALLGIIFAKGLTDLLKGMPAEFAGDTNPLHKADKALAKVES